MTSKPIRRLRPIIYPILFFFCWTNLGIYNIAYAAANGSGQGSVAGGQLKTRNAEEKFQEFLDKIRDGVEKEDRQKVKTEKAKLEKHDVEIKKQFKDTEDKIKDLPEAIKQRHREFVRKYEENLSALKGHLDGIEKAKSKAEEKVEVEKAKAFLEKTKAPKKHVPLDPNKLPHRTPEIKKREPRLKKEEFEPQRAQRTASIMVAANGPLTGLVSELPTYQSQNTILAQNTIDLPTPADLSQTIEVQFTPDINAKAQELGYNSVKIYEWVRNNIEYVPTYGSIQGADMCLQTKQCNDFDTASLLIALLRASNISARYVYGTIELPVEKVMNWVGGATDPRTAANILATNGIPAKVIVSGGAVKAVQLEHAWVKAWIDYIPSRGAVHKQGDTWIPLDPSFKQYNYTTGIDVKSVVPFDAQTFIDQIKTSATINETEGYVTNVSSTLVQQTMQSYQTSVQSYITQNYPNATVGDVLGKKEIAKQVFGILPATLPYKTVTTGSEFAKVNSQYQATISFAIPDQWDIDLGLAYTITLPQIAGKKITLSFSPATANDEAIINSYLPKPHADGTPIQPSELPSSLPAYLINLKPELRIDGQVVATGATTTMGRALPFTMSLNEPGNGISNIDNIVTAGEYFGIGIDPARIGTDALNKLKTKLEATKAKLEAQSYSGLTKDDIVGDMLYATISSYFAELDTNDDITARTMGMIRYRATSIGMFSLSLSTNDFFGVPVSASPRGMMMDVDRIMQTVFSKDGDMTKVKQYMLLSGSKSSELEHSVPERLLSTPNNPVQGISAVKALQLANDQGIPIYTVAQSNIATILPQLQIDPSAISDIQNAVNAGKIVTVSKTNVNFNGQSVCGYVIIDPTTGAGAYMIANASGALILTALDLVFFAIIMAGTLGAIAIVGAILIAAIGAIAQAITALAIITMAAWQTSLALSLIAVAFAAYNFCNSMIPPGADSTFLTAMTAVCTYILTVIGIFQALR